MKETIIAHVRLISEEIDLLFKRLRRVLTIVRAGVAKIP